VSRSFFVAVENLPVLNSANENAWIILSVDVSGLVHNSAAHCLVAEQPGSPLRSKHGIHFAGLEAASKLGIEGRVGGAVACRNVGREIDYTLISP